MSLSKKLALLAALALVATACSGGTTASAGASLTPVKFQLKWVAQTQFAGYYAALDQNYYKDAGLDVSLLLGGPNINEVQIVATGGADMGTTWLPSMLQSREGGTDLVEIAQLYQRSGTRMASFKTANITTPNDMGGKRIGSWLGGNEPELFAALTKVGLDPTKENIIKQNFDMSGLLKGDLDVAQAMIYNEYAQVLEAKNPATGQLYQPTDFTVVDFNDPSVGTAMLQDEIFASDKWLKTGNNADTATKFLTASYKGWIYCRDNPDKCVQIVLAKGSQLGASHQAWQMNEVNGLIWPSPDGIGVLNVDDWNRTIDTATAGEILTKAPADGAYRLDLTTAALDGLDNATGTDWKKPVVEISPGGE
jgi:NitT/TauT family transport system substrate-binding protein